jgi:hypothetical protein
MKEQDLETLRRMMVQYMMENNPAQTKRLHAVPTEETTPRMKQLVEEELKAYRGRQERL